MLLILKKMYRLPNKILSKETSRNLLFLTISSGLFFLPGCTANLFPFGVPF